MDDTKETWLHTERFSVRRSSIVSVRREPQRGIEIFLRDHAPVPLCWCIEDVGDRYERLTEWLTRDSLGATFSLTIESEP